jgi:peptidoglycan hydrolase CwlO-like protein
MNETIILLISNTLTGIATFFVSRRQQETLLENTILDNLTKSIGVYQTIIQDLKEEIAELNLKVNKLEERITNLMDENKKLRSKKPLEK